VGIFGQGKGSVEANLHPRCRTYFLLPDLLPNEAKGMFE
jgi:hypothetical protein